MAGYEVVSEALDGHARTVDGAGDDLEAALKAVRQVNLTSDAYGVIGTRFVTVAEQLAEAGREALGAGVADLEAAAKELRATVATFHCDDDSGATGFGAVATS